MADSYNGLDREHRPSGHMPEEFDRVQGVLDGTPGITKTRPYTLSARPLMGVGGSTSYIVETWRQRIESMDDETPADIRDITFLTIAGPTGYFRHVLPAEVVDAMFRQREALATKLRKALGKQHAPRLRQMAKDRIARGEQPAFLKNRKKGRK
jgi:hypothetical protein